MEICILPSSLLKDDQIKVVFHNRDKNIGLSCFGKVTLSVPPVSVCSQRNKVFARIV